MSTKGTTYVAPGLAAVMLVGLLAVHTIERDTAGGVDVYMAQAAVQIDGVPNDIGPFKGRETTVAPAAVELLQPNRILQRRYTVLETGEWFSLLIVHCQVAKDMYGHYPPNCYPLSGWAEEFAPNDLVLETSGMAIPAKRYRFTREGDVLDDQMDILSFFVLPSGEPRFGSDMSLVDKSSRLPWTDKLGAAQVQILTPAEMPDERRREIWNMALDAIAPVLHIIAEGPA